MEKLQKDLGFWRKLQKLRDDMYTASVKLTELSVPIIETMRNKSNFK
jgi:hypothetical protein